MAARDINVSHGTLDVEAGQANQETHTVSLSVVPLVVSESRLLFIQFLVLAVSWCIYGFVPRGTSLRLKPSPFILTMPGPSALVLAKRPSTLVTPNRIYWVSFWVSAVIVESTEALLIVLAILAIRDCRNFSRLWIFLTPPHHATSLCVCGIHAAMKLCPLCRCLQ